MDETPALPKRVSWAWHYLESSGEALVLGSVEWFLRKTPISIVSFVISLDFCLFTSLSVVSLKDKYFIITTTTNNNNC